VEPVISQEINFTHSVQHSFIENKGQWKDHVLFQSKINGGNLWVEQGRFLFELQDFSELRASHNDDHQHTDMPVTKKRVVELLFNNSNLVTDIKKDHVSTNYYNYFIGNDKDKWAKNVRGYGEAILSEFYDGIDLKIIEQEYELKYEFHVHPGSTANQIEMIYNGAEKIEIDASGNLIVYTDLGNIIEKKPYVYQIVNGNIREVPSNFQLIDNKVTFRIGKYNPNVDLIIDPVLIFATYSGSITDNFGMTATYGHDGTAYSGGLVFGNSYPTPAPSWNTTTTLTNVMPVANDPAGTYGVTDVFISKYSADGSTMLWTCFLGGGNDSDGTESVHSLICDSLNNLYLYGATSSLDFPTQNAYQSTHAGGVSGANFYNNAVYYMNNGTDIFVSKLSSDGMNLLGSTFIGGSANDGVNYNDITGLQDSLVRNYGDQFRGEIMLDRQGNCLVASCTRSTDFPVLNAFQPSSGGRQDGVVFKLTGDLSTLIHSSYFGGAKHDACYSIKIDSSDNIVFAGGTASLNLPTTVGVWQTSYNGGKTDGFVSKLDPTGTSITAVSYIGTTNYDQVYFVEIDRNDNVFVLGQSQNGDFPVINSNFVIDTSSQFIAKLDPTLATVLNSTVFGNGAQTLNISPSAFLVDLCGNVYVSGWGSNLKQGLPVELPLTSDAVQNTTTGYDFYLLVVRGDFDSQLYGTYFGGARAGEHVDGGTSRFDKNGVVYQSVCGGCGSFSDGITTSGAWSEFNLSDNCNNLVFKFDFELIPNAEFLVDQNIGCVDFAVTFDNFSSASDSYLWDFGNGDTTSVIFNPTVIYDTVGVFNVYLYVTDSICLLTDTAEITITVYDSLELYTTPDQIYCDPTALDITAYTNGTANTFIWSSNNAFTDTLNTDITDSVYTVTPTTSTTYYVRVENSGCFRIDSVVVDFIGASVVLSGDTEICSGDTTLITLTSSNPAIIFTYVWSPDSVIVTPSNTNQVYVQPHVNQFINVIATSNSGCVVYDSIFIEVDYLADGLAVATASDYYIPEGSEVTLFGEPSGYSYQWSPLAGLETPNAQNTIALVSESTTYLFTIIDGNCAKSDTVKILTYPYVCDEPYLFVPNAFSPNDDGENDVLFVRGPLIKEMVFRIYDRWGELIFESFDRATGWDGLFRGKPMDPDVYDYYLKVTCIDEVETIIKGNITLLK